MSAAVAVALVYGTSTLKPEHFEGLTVFAKHTLLMLCERDRNPIAKDFATQLLSYDSQPWQLRCRALWYLVTLNESTRDYVDHIERLRIELDNGATFCDDQAPDPLYYDSDMAELQMLGLEMLVRRSAETSS
jgi:hypothetical protein